ncbi:hypothetical protein MGA447_1658 [Enterococcus faecalis]|nr:hypothetical protein HMPREF0349_1131 [Enterococcus faecalis TX1322]EFM67154.1 hypothetical protein HMPREF9509_01699 [Enterococcus faecalis TX0411]EFT41908.1 hypothetical protein HMPREF9496_01076 [Enterococcus faecalis TX4000]OSH19043.1 hypothetical protein MGA447_1658 [Enterococcus faecalis]OSH27157.1 hypothetical protein EFQH95_2589 [Enterococcus faecalis]
MLRFPPVNQSILAYCTMKKKRSAIFVQILSYYMPQSEKFKDFFTRTLAI